MSLDAIKQVTETHIMTHLRLEQAGLEAKKIVSDAERAGRERLEQARAAAEAQVKLYMKDAEDRASKHAEQVMEETRAACGKLRQEAEGRMAQAAALIVGRVVNV